MSCNRHVKYFLQNDDGSQMYGYGPDGKLTKLCDLPWLKPYLFSSVKKARKVAKEIGFVVTYYNGKAVTNRPDENMA